VADGVNVGLGVKVAVGLCVDVGVAVGVGVTVANGKGNVVGLSVGRGTAVAVSGLNTATAEGINVGFGVIGVLQAIAKSENSSDKQKPSFKRMIIEPNPIFRFQKLA
jgi:hypothetical protein